MTTGTSPMLDCQETAGRKSCSPAMPLLWNTLTKSPSSCLIDIGHLTETTVTQPTGGEFLCGSIYCTVMRRVTYTLAALLADVSAPRVLGSWYLRRCNPVIIICSQPLTALLYLRGQTFGARPVPPGLVSFLTAILVLGVCVLDFTVAFVLS
ncbi:hypothetical protein F5Y09DRAFT_10140 [Xylaria sp. FL1042]|nr:hypothetical protein F5Y09DRAFT_10140 [Xylaria sp. FL1042]